MEKDFKTYKQQIEILKNRGLNINNDDEIEEILKKENYYNLINGYKDPFIDTSMEDEFYKRGSDFYEIYSLYKFDRKIRNIFLEKILVVENNIKSALAYVFSKRYGCDNYLKVENFDVNSKNLGRILKLIAHIQNDLARQIDRNSSINHYMSKYGYVPLWVLVNILTFGTVSRFFNLMKLKERQNVAKMFNISEGKLNSFLRILSLYRNLCAHDERFYNFKTKAYISNTNIHYDLVISKENGNFKYGKNDIFALLICLKKLLSGEKFLLLFRELETNINLLKEQLHTITMGDVLEEMGFPDNWNKIVES